MILSLPKPLWYFCVCLLLFRTVAHGDPEPWQIFTECKFLPKNYYDGDSFSIRTWKEDAKRGYTYIFRIYGADCPESNATQEPERIIEQAGHFRMAPADITKWGEAAAEFTAQALTSGEVTVITRKSEAGGQSKNNRYYAFVEINGEDLALMLIERGLARAHGISTAYKGQSADQYRRLLERKERTAKQNRVGIWSEAQLPL